MKGLAKLGWMAALFVAVATYPLVGLLSLGAVDAYVLAAKSESMVRYNKDSFEPRGPKETDAEFHKRIKEVFGNPVDYTTSVLFVPKEKFVRPAEAPSLILLPVDKDKHENPLQVKSLYFFAKYVVMGAGAAFVVLLLLSRFLRKPEPKPAASP